MKIILDNEWYIEDDGSGFILTNEKLRTVQKKDGTTVMEMGVEFQNYPATIESCIQHYVRRSTVNKHDALTLKEYVDTINNKYDEVKKLVKGERE